MLRFRPAFTPFGAIVLFIALIGLIRSLIVRNAYEIVLASAALFFLLTLGIIGIWKSRKLKTLEPGWKPPFPMTANAGEETLVNGLETPVPLFFRMHFLLQGWFLPCGSVTTAKKGCFASVETSVPRGETSALLPLDFPMSGIFHGNGFCRLRDIFGLFSFSCGLQHHKTVKVRCAPCFGKKTPINAQTGAEDQQKKPAADIERYYMREYTPGDRFRDINWKSSEKIDTLITRISTDNQERISRIEIHLRNYGPVNASLESLWLLDRAKARLSFFLRSLMEQNSLFIFDVRTAGGNWEIENQDDLDVFFEDITGLSFFPPQHETTTPSGTGDMYVFSTACDTVLPDFLLKNNHRAVNLFLVQPLNKKTENKEQEADSEILSLSDFDKKGCVSPVLWLRKDVNWLNVQAGKVEMFSAGIKL